MMKKYIVAFALGFSALAFIAAAAFLVYRLAGRAPVDVAQEVEESEDVEQEREINEDGDVWVTNPTSGSRWYVQVLAAQGATQAMVLVPGGEGSSSAFLKEQRDAQDLADAGYTVVLFDPEGRGQSEGEEDQNGTIGQDGLKAVVEFAAAIDGIKEVGIASFSYGITMASGMLARYPEVPVAFLIDWEGPSDREGTGGCDGEGSGHLNGKVACDDEDFWSQREAVTFIDDITVPYLRLQTEVNHAKKTYDYTIRMVNAAVAGSAPWVRLNNETPNVTYTEATLPRMLPEQFDRVVMTEIAKLAKELFAM